MSKPRIIKDYAKLSDELKEQLKLVYPLGFTDHLIPFVNRLGERKKGLPFEMEDAILLVRMTVSQAQAIIEEDPDYNDEGRLRKGAQSEYEDKFEDLDFIKELNSNEDNDFDDGDFSDDDFGS